MINKEENNEKENKNESQLNNKEEEKENKQESEQNIINEKEEFQPIIQKIFIKSAQKEQKLKDNKIKNINEEKNDNLDKNDLDSPLKIPFMRLSKGKLNTLKYNTLMGLEPFFTEFNNHMEKKGEEIIKEISNDYKDEEFELNKIIFKYGDEADRFFIINEGEVSLYLPFTEVINMNIDEYYIYILRLRRYNETEMLNNVLLLNRGEFMIEFDEGFILDEYIIKLYNTHLKLKYDPTFLNKEEVIKKKKIKKIKNINKNKIKNNNNRNNYNNNFKYNFSINGKIYLNDNNYYDESKGFDDNKFPTFNIREMKELVLRIGDEILETMKWIMPERIYNVIEERKDNNQIRKRIINIHNKFLEKFRALNPNNVNEKEYYQRILPIKIENNKLIQKNIIVMKYLYINTLKKGQWLGDFCPDSLSLFSPTYLRIAKNSRINLKMHVFHHFRNMTAISTKTLPKKDLENENEKVLEKKNDDKGIKKEEKNKYIKITIDNLNKENNNHKNGNKLHLLSFSKKIFFAYFSKFIENFTYHKKNFLLNNGLFLNTNNKNLVKTYSICFKERKLKEGDFIIKENDKLNDSNINIYFIIKGEFQATCTKTICQLDEIIKLLGHERNISETFPKLLKGFINTPYYNILIKKPLNLKLNYLNKNDIIGLSESFINDEYFNNVQCKSITSLVYYVDARIIKLLVDSDQIINNNKNIMLYYKYEMLSDILLKQRKIYFDSFFNAEKYNVLNIINKSNNPDENDSREMISDNYTNNIVQNDIAVPNLVIIPKINKILPAVEAKMSIFNNSKIQSNPNIVKKNNDKKLKKVHSQGNILLKNLGDLDTMLANLSGRFTLKDKRIERSLIFRKKYQEKMEQLEKEKKLKEEEKLKKKEILSSQNQMIIYKGKIPNNQTFYEFKKSNSTFNKMFRLLPLLPNRDKYLQSEGEYKFIIPYKKTILKKSNSACNINPLAYDDFNRSYNTGQYFHFKFNEKKMDDKSKERKKDYIIEFKSDIKLVKKKNNNIIKKNDILTRKLRNIYKGKFDRVLYNTENRLKKIVD